MKVIFLTKNYKPELGGTYTVIKSIFDELSKKIDVKVYDKSTNIFSLIKIIKKSNICHFFGGWDFFHLFFTNLAFLMNKYVIIHPLGFYDRWCLDNKKLKKYIAMFCYQKRILQKADLIHCASAMEKKDILKIDKTLNAQVIPFGLANNFYNKKKKILKIKHRALFFSRIDKKKNLHNLINEWIKIDNKKWSLDICGPCEDSAYHEYLSSLAKNSNSINFLPPVYADVAKINLFKKYDFMILPTKSDTFALAILECLANGLPVLTSHNVPWASIKKMNAGWYIPCNNSILGHTLKKIFKLKPKDFFIKSKNSYALAQKFNWNIVRTDYISTYTKLLENK